MTNLGKYRINMSRSFYYFIAKFNAYPFLIDDNNNNDNNTFYPSFTTAYPVFSQEN